MLYTYRLLSSRPVSCRLLLLVAIRYFPLASPTTCQASPALPNSPGTCVSAPLPPIVNTSMLPPPCVAAVQTYKNRPNPSVAMLPGSILLTANGDPDTAVSAPVL